MEEEALEAVVAGVLAPLAGVAAPEVFADVYRGEEEEEEEEEEEAEEADIRPLQHGPHQLRDTCTAKSSSIVSSSVTS